MFKNYLKIALRNLFKAKGFSFINILGLAIGMICCILILLYVLDERSFDRHNENIDRIYRVILEQYDADGSQNRTWALVSPGYGSRLRDEFSAIEHAVRFWPWSFPVISYEGKKFVESAFTFAEPEVFDIFTLPFLSGDAKSALTEPNTLVLTSEAAQKYFGKSNPLGKTLNIKSRNFEQDFKVTGVIETIPKNSHFRFDFLASFSNWEKLVGDENMKFLGGDFNYATYVLLEKGTDVEQVSAQFPDFLGRNMAEVDGRKPFEKFRIVLQPLHEVYLHSDFDSEYAVTGDATHLTIFSTVAVLILIIACINFINLTTARSIRRAKEVGMRKVLGAFRSQLLGQFLGESATFAIFAMLLALVGIELLLPAFSDFTGKELTLITQNYNIFGWLIGIVLFVGLIGGGYPAFVLSKFRPICTLKSASLASGKKSHLRAGLIIFQLVVSITLIICVGVVNKQLHYLNSKELGFDKKQIISLPASQSMMENLASFKQQLTENPAISAVTASSRVPSGILGDALSARVFKSDHEVPAGFRLPFVRIDHDYFDLFDMEIIAGRTFSKEFSSDSSEAFILNETAIADLGWPSPQDAIGQPFFYGRSRGRIIGVVKDFHFESMHQKIKPMVFYISPFVRRISIKIALANLDQTLKFLREKWKIHRPDYPFTYFFIDERFEQRYQSEQKLGNLFRILSSLAIFIACLGLFGLATYMADQRTKEIGVRKVLGASVPNIFRLLANQFVKLALLANIFAWPLAAYFMQKWLDSFAYNTSLSWEVFFNAAGLALGFAVVTVSYQALKAAFTNPIEALRYE